MIQIPSLIIPKPLVLLPQRRIEWLGPSTEHGIKRSWVLTAYLNDGAIRNRWRFNDRDEADAFLYEGGWQSPGLLYDFTTVNIITTTSAANQTWAVPIDFSLANYVEVLAGGGAGAGGGSAANVNIAGGGGAGGGYSKTSRIPLTPGGTATFRLEAEAPATATDTSGAAGKDAWFNGATLPASSVSATAGAGGTFGGGGGSGSTANSIGDIKFAGGNGGAFAATDLSGSGGGAAGPHGAGGNGTTNGNGGSADNGTTAGGAGNGVSGTQFDATHGCGTGGGSGAGGAGFSGGAYGGGGGGNIYIGGTGGIGKQGLIAVTFAPMFFGADADSIDIISYKKLMLGY